MRLIQKKFEFQNSERVSPNAVETAGLKLVVNGINTDLSIGELFSKCNASAGYIKGWSFLSLLQNPTDKENFNSLDIKGNKFEISFMGPSGNFYQIYAIEDPTIQYDSQDVEQTEIDRMIALLLSTQPESETEVETETDTEEPEESETPKLPLADVVSADEPEVKVEENGAAPEEKAAEAEVETDKGSSAIASEPGEAEAEAASEQHERPEESEEYTKTRFALERKGYVEYSNGNFKLFGKPEGEPYLVVTEGDSVEELAIEEMETDEDNKYFDYFTTYQDKSIVFRFIIATEELTIFDPKPETV